MTFSTRSAPVILLAAILLAGCGGSSAPPSAIGPNGNVTNAATNQADTAAVEARLRGTWRIAEYRSEVPT